MKNKIVRILILLLAVSVIISNTDLLTSFAVPLITADEDAYPLYVEDFPEAVTAQPYAKFKSAKANVDDYHIDLTTDDDSDDAFARGIKSANIKLADNQMTCSFTTTLYLTDDDGDEIKKTDAVEVLCPVPDDAQEHYQDCELYIISGGKAKPANYKLVVDSDEVFYVQFSLPTYGTYGFIYRDPDSYEEDEDENDDDDDGEDDELDDDDFIGDDEDEDDPTPTPTPTPTPAPTKAPKPTNTPTPKPTKAPSATPVPTKKPVATPKPTQKVDKNSNNSSSSNNSKKDSIPKTGDDFPLEGLATVGGISGIVLITTVILLKKRK